MRTPLANKLTTDQTVGSPSSLAGVLRPILGAALCLVVAGCAAGSR
jgi:hypothetical protein